MRKKLTTNLLSLLLCLAGTQVLFAQNGTISGKVSLSGEDLPLEGIAVFLDGTNYADITNSQGLYKITGIPSGKYKLVSSSIGYNTFSKEITINGDESLTIDIPLVETVLGLPEAVVASVSLTGGLRGLKNVPGSAHYLSPLELETFSYTDINRALGAVPGVNIQEEDGFGLRPNIGLRGSGSERSAKITVMEDGVLAAPAPYAAPAAYYFPTMGRMQAVEILKGSSQVRFGPYTTGGAINLISTAIPDRFSGKVDLLAGEFGTRKLHAWVGDSHRNVAYVVETFQLLSDGFKKLDNDGPTGFDKKDYLAKLRLNTGPTASVYQSLTFKIGQTTEASNETYLGLSDQDFEKTPYRRYAGSQMDLMKTEHQQYSVQHFAEFSSKLDLTTTAYYNKFHRNWYKLDKVVDSSGQKVGIAGLVNDPVTYAEAFSIVNGASSQNDEALQVKANNRSYKSRGVQTVLGFRPSAAHTFDLGLRFHKDELDRFQWVDAYRMDNGVMELTKPGTPGTESNRLESATAFAAYLQYKLKIGQWTFIPGVRYENIELARKDYGKNDPERTGADLSERSNQVDVLIPGVGATYQLNMETAFFAGIHKGFAPPGSKEGTQPESSINYEAGLRYRKGVLSAQAVVFMNDYDNLLGADLAAGGGTGSGDLFNGGAAQTKGLELEVTYDLLGDKSGLGLPLHLSYTFTDAHFHNSFDSDFEGWGTVADGDELPYLAKHQLALQAGFRFNDFSANLNLRYQSDMRTAPGQGDIPANELIEGYTVIDFSTQYQLSKQAALFLSVNNLTDRVYAVARNPAGLRPGLPRMVLGGVKVRF
ncbi:MAG: TonB-dependent receptor [Saprospirales bacterium]|nr:TonB-dependent receptor [Saprospirales bacterium]